MPDQDIRGRFLWYDLMTTDPKGGQEFYAKVAGWGLQPFPDPSMPYTMFTRGGGPIGGSMQLPDEAVQMGAPSHWIPYIGTPDVDKVAAANQAAGGRTYVPPTDIPNVGRFTVLADPQGATIAFLTPSNEQPASHAPEVGDFSWHELVTTDLDGGMAFYTAHAGWEKTGEHDMGPMGVYHMFGRQGATLGGMFKKPEDMPAPSHWMLYIRVADIDKSVEVVSANGGQIVNGPMEVPGGDWVVNCVDPQGAFFALHQRNEG